MLVFRELKRGDFLFLLDLDRKNSEFPYSLEDWELLLNYNRECFIDILTTDGKIIGFAITESTKDGRLVINKIVGDRDACLVKVEERARQGLHKILEYVAPACSCRGGDDPYDISAWLLKSGFMYKGFRPKDFYAYGKEIEVYIFQKEVTNE